MASPFYRTTKSSLSTADVTVSAATNILTVTAGSTAVLIGVLISNKTASSALANVYLSAATGDSVYLIKSGPVPAGSSLELVSGNKIVLNGSDVLRASSDTASALDITLSYLIQT